MSKFPLLFPSGPVAQGDVHIILLTFMLCMIVVLPVLILLFYFAWRYRAGGPAARAFHAPNWDHDNKWVEFFWWLIPIAIIAVLAVVAWRSSYALDPYKALPGPSLTVEVVALDWKWLFIYPGYDIATVNKLVLPSGEAIHLLLTADAPMNSFWIPQLSGQIMVMPGMQTQLNLEADRPGTFNGYSANISGTGFSGMAFAAQAVAPEDFSAWVQQTQSSTSSPLTEEAYQALAKPSANTPPQEYAPVSPNLYTGIMQKYMMPGMQAAPMPLEPQ